MFSQALEEDFVESRREGQDQMTVDDFHSLLTLARSDLCFRSLTYIGADRSVDRCRMVLVTDQLEAKAIEFCPRVRGQSSRTPSLVLVTCYQNTQLLQDEDYPENVKNVVSVKIKIN